MTEQNIWIVTTSDTFGSTSIDRVFDNEAAANEFARNAWGSRVSHAKVESDVPDWARDIKKVGPRP